MVNNDRQSEKKLSEKQKRDIRRSIESKLSP